MKTIFFLISLSALGAQAWYPVISCDNGTVVVDELHRSNYRYQLVLRGHVVDWLVNEARLVPKSKVNDRGEIIQEKLASRETGSHRSYHFPTGDYQRFVSVELHNFPPRIEAKTYNPKSSYYGDVHKYYLHECEGL